MKSFLNLTSNLSTGTGMKNLGLFVTFYVNGTQSRSLAKKSRLRIQQKVAAQPALAPQH
jgi:hypothetical protein